MDRERFLSFAIAGALINGALYNALVVAVAIVTGKPVAADFAIVSAGFAYLNCSALAAGLDRAGFGLNVVAVVAGISGGLLLLW